MNVSPIFKTPKGKRAKGRARPDDPLGRCEFRQTIDVQGKPFRFSCVDDATERHHVLRRSQGGGDEAANTKDLCLAHHVYVHANPSWSYAHGYLIRGVTGA